MSGSFLVIGGSDSQPNSVFQKVSLSGQSETMNTWPSGLLNLSELPASDPDIVVLSTEEASLGIERVRELQKQLAIKPILRPEKIALIKEAEKLTEEAQNALLKILEEPPQDTIIILVASSEDFFLPTVLSRCQVIYASQKVENIDPSEEKKLQAVLADLPKFPLAERLKLAAQVSKNRQEALLWLDKMLIVIHKLNLDKLPPRLTGSIFDAKKYLRANCNVRLTMENLLLNW